MRRPAMFAAAALAASSSGCALYNGLVGMCEGDVYSASVNQSIPDDNDTGVTSMISIPLTGRPDGIGLKLDVSHDFESDLQIRLAHNNIIIEVDGLDDNGPFHQFDGVDVGGSWIINVADTLSADTGYWTDWEISVCGR